MFAWRFWDIFNKNTLKEQNHLTDLIRSTAHVFKFFPLCYLKHTVILFHTKNPLFALFVSASCLTKCRLFFSAFLCDLFLNYFLFLFFYLLCHSTDGSSWQVSNAFPYFPPALRNVCNYCFWLSNPSPVALPLCFHVFS